MKSRCSSDKILLDKVCSSQDKHYIQAPDELYTEYEHPHIIIIILLSKITGAEGGI